MKIFPLIFLLLPGLALAGQPMASAPKQTAELWEGKALTATFRVGVCYTPKGAAKGVLLLKHRTGQEDVYHLFGTVKNNEFFLTHSSGHVLSGKLTSPTAMEGKARLKSGIRLTLSGKRSQNATLAAADCAPLPK